MSPVKFAYSPCTDLSGAQEKAAFHTFRAAQELHSNSDLFRRNWHQEFKPLQKSRKWMNIEKKDTGGEQLLPADYVMDDDVVQTAEVPLLLRDLEAKLAQRSDASRSKWPSHQQRGSSALRDN